MTDEDEFVQIIERQGGMVYKLAFVYMKNEFDAEDVYQNVFERYLKYHPQFKNMEHEKNWFAIATINVCKSTKTSAWERHNVTFDDLEWEKIISAASMNELTTDESIVIEAVLQLNEEERLIIQLYYYEDYSIRSISAMVGLKESAVYTKLSRARKKMKRFLMNK